MVIGRGIMINCTEISICMQHSLPDCSKKVKKKCNSPGIFSRMFFENLQKTVREWVLHIRGVGHFCLIVRIGAFSRIGRDGHPVLRFKTGDQEKTGVTARKIPSWTGKKRIRSENAMLNRVIPEPEKTEFFSTRSARKIRRRTAENRIQKNPELFNWICPDNVG